MQRKKIIYIYIYTHTHLTTIKIKEKCPVEACQVANKRFPSSITKHWISFWPFFKSKFSWREGGPDRKKLKKMSLHGVWRWKKGHKCKRKGIKRWEKDKTGTRVLQYGWSPPTTLYIGCIYWKGCLLLGFWLSALPLFYSLHTQQGKTVTNQNLAPCSTWFLSQVEDRAVCSCTFLLIILFLRYNPWLEFWCLRQRAKGEARLWLFICCDLRRIL